MTDSTTEHTDRVPLDQIVDSVQVRPARVETGVKDLTGRAVPLGAITFMFGSPTIEPPGRLAPITFIATPDILRDLGRLIRDTANRAANLAEGKP